jgi:sensor histidine kinase YesM
VKLEALADGDRIVIRVTDNGPGIPVDQRRALVSGPVDGAHALALLRRRLVGLYDSMFTLTIEDPPGGGAIVTIRLPRECDPAPAGWKEEER